MTLVKNGLSSPVFLTNAGDDRLFVVEQGGAIKIIHDDNSVSTFLDLTSIVQQGGGEQGLLGLAFHPNYATQRPFLRLLHALAGGNSEVLAEYQRSSGDADVADHNSQRVLLDAQRSIHQPQRRLDRPSRAATCTCRWATAAARATRRTAPRTSAGGGARSCASIPLDPDGNGPLKYSIPARNPFVASDRQGRDLVIRAAQPMALLVR